MHGRRRSLTRVDQERGNDSDMCQCSKCGETHDDQFESCWKCAGEVMAPTPKQPAPNPIRCPRCITDLDFVGTKRFHEGTKWGLIGELGEIFVNRESFDIYVCPRWDVLSFLWKGLARSFDQNEAEQAGCTGFPRERRDWQLVGTGARSLILVVRHGGTPCTTNSF